MFQPIPTWLIYLLTAFGLFIAFFSLLIFVESQRTFRQEKKLKSKTKPAVTFLIPAYNAAYSLPATVESIFNLKYPKSKLKVLIIDDGSQDDTPKVLKKLARKFPIKVFRKQHEGKPKALNYGIKKVRTSLTVILDSDTVVEPDSLIKALGLLKKGITAVSVGLMPLQRRGWLVRMQQVEYAMTSLFKKLLSNIKALPHAPDYTVFRTKWLKENEFDSNEHNLTEDFEMALRIHSKGGQVAHLFETGARTEVPTTFSKLKRQRIRWNYGAIYNFGKYKGLLKRGNNLALYALPSMIFGMLIIGLVFLLGSYSFIAGLVQYAKLLSVGWRPSFMIFGREQILFTFSELPILLGAVGIALSFLYFSFVKKEKKDVKFIDWIFFITIYIWLLSYFYVTGAIKYLTKNPQW